MTTPNRSIDADAVEKLRADIIEWRNDRAEISHIENHHGGAFSRWHGSDDWAVDLLEQVGAAIGIQAEDLTPYICPDGGCPDNCPDGARRHGQARPVPGRVPRASLSATKRPPLGAHPPRPRLNVTSPRTPPTKD
jgi:hypothetical protein